MRASTTGVTVMTVVALDPVKVAEVAHGLPPKSPTVVDPEGVKVTARFETEVLSRVRVKVTAPSPSIWVVGLAEIEMVGVSSEIVRV